MRRIFLSLFIPIILLNQAQAAWIDDYFDSAVTTNATSFQSQKYGYYSGGGFSARVPHRPESLMSASVPSIKMGCGGIDTFWGGISFMNADYLVKKAEGVLKNAPYVVFSIGLKSLSSLFGDTIESVQAIIDQLNQLQIDECSAAKGIVNLATGDASGILDEWNMLKTNAEKLGKGVSSDWSKVKKMVDKDPIGEKNKEAADMIKDPKALKFLTGSGYVLNVLASEDMKRLTLAEANAMRALVGDIYFNNTGKDETGKKLDGSVANLVEGCASSVSLNTYMISNTPFQQVGNAECEYTNPSIYSRADNSLQKIKNALTGVSDRTKPYDTNIVNFINASNIPVFAYMASASVAGEEYLESTSKALVPVVALGYAYGSLKNLSNNIRHVISALDSDMGNQAAYAEKIIVSLKEYNEKVRLRMEDFEREYEIEIAKLDKVFGLAKRFEETNRELYDIRNSVLLTQMRERP